MKFRSILYILSAFIITLAGFAATDVQAAKKSKAKTSVAAKKKSTSNKKKNIGNKKKSKKVSAKRKKSVSKKRVKRNGISHKQYTPPVDLPLNDSLTLLVNSEVISWIPENLNPGGLRVNLSLIHI